MVEYWSWWVGALALGGVSIGSLLLMGKLIGVSGSWAKVMNWREERQLASAVEEFAQADAGEMEDALLAETLAEFGAGAVEDVANGETESAVADAQPATPTAVPGVTPWTAHLVFLGMMFVGALIAALSSDSFLIELQISNTHSQIFGDPWQVWLALLFGGMMVGFGTQMAGGCPSGHGLSGCARLIPASLLATVVFLGSAIVLSLLMKGMS